MAVINGVCVRRLLRLSQNFHECSCLHQKSRTQWHRHRRWFSSRQPLVGEVNVRYDRGLPVITLPLPSRQEQCQFTLKPVTNNVGDFLRDVRNEDHGIDRISILNSDGTRIASSTSIERLLMSEFCLMINDLVYKVTPPPIEKLTSEELEQISNVKCLISRLYETMNVDEHQLRQEQQLLSQLENLKQQIAPLEQGKLEIAEKTLKRNGAIAWLGLGLMGVQFGTLARLTWWEYSWDIMEPVTYFITYGTSMFMYSYYVLTRQEYIFPDIHDRQFLITFHKQAKKIGLDVGKYNELNDSIADVKNQLRRLRDPLQIRLPVKETGKSS